MQFVAPYSLIGDSANLTLHLHPDHLADLRASGLNDETIMRAGVYSIRPCDIALFFSARKGVPPRIHTALCFPYQGGEFARIKLFPPLGRMKYSQPPKTEARLYMSLPVRDGEIVVTEGEKKTLAAHQAGLNAVGIGGLWNWLTNGEPIADLNRIEWEGRELRERGASVNVAEIPQHRSKKIGLDDYLVSGGQVENLETFTLGGQAFRSVSFWYSRWKFQKPVREAA